MSSKDKFITLCIFFVGWAVLLFSTSLPFFYINHLQALSLDKITWTIWDGTLVSNCDSTIWLCQWLFGSSKNIVYGGWLSFNFLILILVVYPFIDVIGFLKNGSYIFGQKGLKEFALSVVFYNLYVFGMIYLVARPVWKNVTFNTGFIFYIVGLAIVYLSVFYGIRRSRLNRDSNYQ